MGRAYYVPYTHVPLPWSCVYVHTAFPSLSQVPGWLCQSISLTPCMLVIGWDGGRYFYHDSFLAVMDAVDGIVIPFFTKEQSVLVSLVYFLFSIYYQLLTLLSHVYIASKLTDVFNS